MSVRHSKLLCQKRHNLTPNWNVPKIWERIKLIKYIIVMKIEMIVTL